MTTIAYHNYNSIPFMSGSYAGSRVNGPMSHQYPGIVSTTNNGILYGSHPNPPQYGVANTSGSLSSAKQEYLRTDTTRNNMGTGTVDFCPQRPTSLYVAGLQKSFLVSQCTKYNSPKCSSLYISARKSAAIGKSAYKYGIPDANGLSFKSFDRNDVKTTLHRVRGGGCTAPKKKGSIFNPYQSNCHWGSLVSQNY